MQKENGILQKLKDYCWSVINNFMDKNTTNKYLSIKEFANEVNITTQAIYQRLDKDLKKYLKIIDGKKMINSEAIIKVFGKKSENYKDDIKDNCKVITNKFASDLQEKTNDLQIGLQKRTNNLQSNLQENKNALQETIKALSKQLDEKDRQIKNLQNELNLQNEHVRKQSDRLVSLVEQVNELQRNNQVLLAQKDIDNTKEIAQSKEHKGIFSWLLKKNN